MSTHTVESSLFVSRLRAALCILYVLMAVGVIAELWLTEHSEDFWQAAPIGLALAGVVGIIVSSFWASRAVFWILQLVLVLQILSAGAGVYFHYKVREEFQTEAYPELTGWELFKEAFAQRNPPPLAPGAMALMGMMGLAWSYRHPALGRRKSAMGADEPRAVTSA